MLLVSLVTCLVFRQMSCNKLCYTAHFQTCPWRYRSVTPWL